MNSIPYPTKEKIEYYLNKIAGADKPRENNKTLDYGAIKYTDEALKELIEKFPNNNKLPEIYLKVTAINSLYSTNIYDTYKIAYRILDIKDFDDKLNRIESGIVDEIATGHKIKTANNKERKFYSFATKYCSWHDEKNIFPIYDSYIEKVLTIYLNHKSIPFKVSDFKTYSKFVPALEEFKGKYQLNNSLKEIDKFLWLVGKEIDMDIVARIKKWEEKKIKDKPKWADYKVEDEQS